MGLDNGIILTVKNKISFHEESEQLFYKGYNSITDIVKIEDVSSAFDGQKFSYEICHWRKNWGLRDMIINYLGERNTSSYDLTIEDVAEIRFFLFNLLCDFTDNNYLKCLCSLKEMRDTYAQQITNLSWLLDYMHRNPQAVVEFYDSY